MLDVHPYAIRDHQTVDEAAASAVISAKTVRPALVVAHGVTPIGRVHVIAPDGVVIGRGHDADLVVDDAKASRQHARIRVVGGVWFIEDLGSRNGTHVDGQRLSRPWRGRPRAIRVGNVLFLPVRDIGESDQVGVFEHDGILAGFALRAAWRRIDEAARGGLVLHLRGESGSGKEIAARRFHAHRTGPFVAVNCATIPHELAESMLFGARRGAFSGAVADAQGLVQSAHGGTLFLDEIGELPLTVQAKLLRVLETREVTPLGATRGQHVDFSLVSATHQDLRRAVLNGSFRGDLLYRVAGYTVDIPPLRERAEELALHVTHELAQMPCRHRASLQFIEACALRPWHGNIRELRAHVRRAATEARLRGAESLEVEDLPLTEKETDVRTPAADPLDEHSTVQAALERHAGNVSASARALGVHRTQLRRWISRNGRGASMP